MHSKSYILVVVLFGIHFSYIDGTFLKIRNTPKTKNPIDSLETTWNPQYVIHPTHNHTGTVFFLHGLGGNAASFYESITSLKSEDILIPHPYLKLVFLTAPLREVTYLNKKVVPAWFDIESIHPNRTDQHWLFYEFVISDLKRFAYNEIDQYGWSWDRIIMGGFDMGGAMALNIGFSYGWRMAGVFALSTYLNNNATLYTEMKIRPRERYPQLFWYHGEADETTKIEWARNTYNELIKRKIRGQFHVNSELAHRMCTEEIAQLMRWCSWAVPPFYTTPAWTLRF